MWCDIAEIELPEMFNVSFSLLPKPAALCSALGRDFTAPQELPVPQLKVQMAELGFPGNSFGDPVWVAVS